MALQCSDLRFQGRCLGSVKYLTLASSPSPSATLFISLAPNVIPGLIGAFHVRHNISGLKPALTAKAPPRCLPSSVLARDRTELSHRVSRTPCPNSTDYELCIHICFENGLTPKVAFLGCSLRPVKRMV